MPYSCKESERMALTSKPKQIWKLYLRLACKHFVPCSQCQQNIEKYVKERIILMSFQTGYQITEGVICDVLCEECGTKLVETIMKAERIILGNKEYEPVFELQRGIIND